VNEPCDPPMGIDTCHYASMCREEGDCVNGCEDRRLRAAWQDVLGDAEQLVRQKPLWAKYIKGTPLENDVPVWMAEFALRLLQRDRTARGVAGRDPQTIPPSTPDGADR
jgi:hypothetical protein